MLASSLLLTVALTVFSASPVAVDLPTERVDLTELNFYYDQNGVLLLKQAIFFDWDAQAGRHQVVAWRMVKDDSRLPRPCDGGYETVWMEGGKTLRVVSRHYREAWTQYDVELLERKHLPTDKRRGIFQAKRSDPVADDPLPPLPQ